MKCPIDKTDTLSSITLIENLPAMQCSTCGGVWLDSNAYLGWQKAQGQAQPYKPTGTKVDPALDVDELKLCPNSGHIMGRYRIIAGSDFHIDRCGYCNGVWLDKNEWDTLVELGLHDNVNEFFTRPWQDALHSTEAKNHLDKLYLEKFGAEDYEHIKKIREWVNEHPKKAMLIAFLQSSDPYKV